MMALSSLSIASLGHHHLASVRSKISASSVAQDNTTHCFGTAPRQNLAPQASWSLENTKTHLPNANTHLPDSLGRSLASAALAAALGLSIVLSGVGSAEARLPGVNKPELLPKYYTPVIDAAGFLSEGQMGRIVEEVTHLEEETGYKLRVLAQNYPKTPGLAVKDYWKVDDNTIVFVADPSLGGNILNFNVGAAVDLFVPRSFWSRLSGKYGNIFYWQEKGEDASIEAAVSAIGTCLREPPGPRACASIQ